MSGIYIKGMEMPRSDETITITICGDGLVFEEWEEPGSVFEAVPVPEHGKLLKVLQTERECVSRDCDRNFGKCELFLEQSEILSAYDTLISMFSDPAEEGE